GLLLLWVAWKLLRETRLAVHERHELQRIHDGLPDLGPPLAQPERSGFHGPAPARGVKTLPAALLQIVVADVSMSLDNVLAVAGTARHQPFILVIGLVLSVALMGVAATVIAGLLRRFPWISYLGIILIAWVAATMIYEGVETLAFGRHAQHLPG